MGWKGAYILKQGLGVNPGRITKRDMYVAKIMVPFGVPGFIQLLMSKGKPHKLAEDYARCCGIRIHLRAIRLAATKTAGCL